MSSAPVKHALHLHATPTAPARLAALGFVLDCHAKKGGRCLDKSGPDDARVRNTGEVSNVEHWPG